MNPHVRELLEALKAAAVEMQQANALLQEASGFLVQAHGKMVQANDANQRAWTTLQRVAQAAIAANAEREDLREIVERLQATVRDLVKRLPPPPPPPEEPY